MTSSISHFGPSLPPTTLPVGEKVESAVEKQKEPMNLMRQVAAAVVAMYTLQFFFWKNTFWNEKDSMRLYETFVGKSATMTQDQGISAFVAAIGSVAVSSLSLAPFNNANSSRVFQTFGDQVPHAARVVDGIFAANGKNLDAIAHIKSQEMQDLQSEQTASASRSMQDTLTQVLRSCAQQGEEAAKGQ